MAGTSSNTLRKVLLWTGGVLASLVLLFVLLVLAIRTPWAQQFITDKAVAFVSEKTQTKMSVGRLFITFRGDVQLEEVFIEDLTHDTLVYIGELEAGVVFAPLIAGNINISRINWNGLVANVKRGQDSTFNFDFLIDAFSNPDKPKDTTETSGPLPNIGVGPIDFSDFRLSYRDEIIGLDAKLNLGRLTLETDDIDLNTMDFKVDELALENVTGDVTMWLSPTPSEEDTTSSQLPFISVDDLRLNNIKLSYRHTEQGLVAATDLKELYLTDAKVDLRKQDISLDEFGLKNTVAFVKLPEPEADSKTDSLEAPKPFAWPDWKIKANRLELMDDAVSLTIGNPTATPKAFNAKDMEVTRLQLMLEDVELADQKATLNLKQLALQEKSGFRLDQLGLNVQLDNQQVTVNSLNVETPFNHLVTKVNVRYDAIDSLIQNPLSARFDLNLAEADLSIGDAFFFAPNLRTDTLIRDLGGYPLKLSGTVSGKLDDLTIKNFKANALRSTRLSLDGTIRGLPDTSAIEVNIPKLNLWATKKDLAVFLKGGKADQLPDTMDLAATVKGNMKQLVAQLNLKTNRGNVELSAEAKDMMAVPSAKGTLKVIEVDVESLASVKDLEPVSLTLDFDASGNSLENLAAELDLAFQHLNFQKYDYSDLKLNVSAAEQKAKVNASIQDENIDFDLSLDALLDTLNPQADLNLNLEGINLYALGFSAGNVKIGADMVASYSGPSSNFESSVQVSNGVVVKGSEVYRVRPIDLTLNNSADKTQLTVTSEIVNGNLKANTSIDTIVGSLTNYFKRLASTDSLRAGIMNDSLDVAAHFTVRNSRLLTEALLPKLVRLDSIRLDLEFHPQQDELRLDLIAPKTVYADYALDSLSVHAEANGENLEGTLSFQKLHGGALKIHRTDVGFGLKNKVVGLELNVADSVGEKLAAIATELDISTPTTLVHFIPKGLILNSEEWSMPADNQISIGETGPIFRSMELSNSVQRVSVSNLKSDKPNGFKVNFDGFELASLTSLLNSSDSLVTGRLNGSVRLMTLKESFGIETDIRIDELTAMGIDVGQLKLLANNRESDRYKVNLNVKGQPIDLAVNGTISTAEEVSLDLKADLNRLDIKLVEGFTGGQIRNSSGSIEAHTTVKGPVADVRYDGNLFFNQTKFQVTQLNSRFTLPNDIVRFDNEGLVFKSFKLVDESGNRISMDGKVDTRNLLDPKFDLRLVASNFQPLNSTRDDNDLFYGKAFLDADIKVTGSLSLPVVKAKAKLLKGTDVTVIVPETEAAIEEREGLVRFANMKDTLSTILEPEKGDGNADVFTGIDLIAYLEIDRTTKFQIVIDERSGDGIEVEGEAKLNVEMTPNGIITMSGNYEVESGSYNMKFYGLARRKFEVLSGSRISWSGDPLSAELDLTARYSLKTSASDLMADQLAQSDATTLNRYKQPLPFEVMLHINGELLKPEISFGIDMPPSARQVLDGNVYKRVKQLNSDNSELDKQVFSLIVLNRFMPQSFDADGSSSEAFARSSVSKMLSGQLNKYSAKYLKGVEINFDLNSYTDYQSGTADDKTSLDVNIRKALFNDRVVVQVGGQVDIEGQNRSYGANDIIGDVSLEYLLTKEGQYRLKAFRKNEFQDLVQGQVVVMGLSVMFNKSFNEWKGLFKPREKEGEKAEETEEEEELEEEEDAELENEETE